jgi:flagellum-specific ATP synthase
MPDCNSEGENALVDRARNLLSTFENMAELIRIGAYKQGSDPAVDEAIHYNDALEAFLGQKKDEISHLAEGYSQLAGLLGMADPVAEAPAAEAAPDAAPQAAGAPEDIQLEGLASAQTAMPEGGLAPAQTSPQGRQPAEGDFKKRRDRMAAALNLAQAKTAAPGT